MNNTETLAESNMPRRMGSVSPYTNIGNISPAANNPPVRPMPSAVSPTANAGVSPTANEGVSPTANAGVSPTANANVESLAAANETNVSPAMENANPVSPAADAANIRPSTDLENVKAVSPAFKCPEVAFMPKKPKYATAYVPYQQWEDTFSAEESLKKGTAFPSLYNPYSAKNPPYMCGEMGIHGGDNNG